MPRQNCKIPLFCLVTTLFWASLYTYVPILTTYVEGLGASHKMAGLIVGSYGFVQMLLRIPVGIVSDRYHKRRLFVIFGLFFAAFSAAGILAFKNLNLILLFRSFAGAAAATWVDYTILFSSYYEPTEASKAIGLMNFFSIVGQTAAMFAGGLAADYLGGRAPFATGVAIGIAGLGLSFFLVEKSAARPTKLSFSDYAAFAADRNLLAVSLLAVLVQVLAFATVFGFTPVFAAQHLHATQAQIGLLAVLSNLPGAFSSLIAGSRFAEKWGVKKLIGCGFVLAGAFTVAIPLTKSMGLLILTQIMAGFGRGLSFTLLMGQSIQTTPVAKRATAMGFFQAVYGLGMFVGPVLMGVIGDWTNLRQGFILLGVLGVATAFLAQRMISVE